MLSALQSMPTRGKIILGGSVLAGLVAMFLVFQLATAPSYVTVVSGLAPGDTGKVTQALDAAAISYELQNNGTAVGVVSAKQAEAKVALATAGVDTGGSTKPGNEILDKQKLGASNFQQKVTYQRALEGEIGKNLGNIAGVSSATVQLSLPEDKLFADETRPPTAAVLLTPPANGLDPQQVRGMAKLVAGAVDGLKDENVTITATTGELLWPTADGNQPGGGTNMKLAAENRYASQLEADVNQLLLKTVGPDKAYIEARPTLNVDDVSRDELRYGPQRIPLTSKTDRERLRSNGDAGTPAGARANIEEAAQIARGGESNYRRDTDEKSFGVDKTVQKTKVAPGAVDKLDVALVLDQSLSKGTVSQVRSAVSSAVGLNPERGDTLAVSQIAFAKPSAAGGKSGSPVAAGAVGIAKWIGLAIAFALFLLFTTRALRRREGEALGDARWLTEIDEPRPLAALEAGVPQVSLPPVPPPSPVRLQVNEMADREPEKVAQQLRAWMAEA